MKIKEGEREKERRRKKRGGNIFVSKINSVDKEM